MLEILNVVKEYGWGGLIVAIILIGGYKLIGETLTEISIRTKNKILNRSVVKLKQHAFFNAINYSLNVEIPAMNIFPSRPVRQILIKDLIYCSLASVEEVAQKIANTNHDGWNHATWNYEMRSALIEMNTSFIDKCDNRGMPQTVYRKYLVWYFDRLNHMRIMIDQISGSEIYSTPESKTSALLLSFNLFLVTMVADAERTLKSLNGDITGLMYKGGSIEPLGIESVHIE